MPRLLYCKPNKAARRRPRATRPPGAPGTAATTGGVRARGDTGRVRRTAQVALPWPARLPYGVQARQTQRLLAPMLYGPAHEVYRTSSTTPGHVVLVTVPGKQEGSERRPHLPHARPTNSQGKKRNYSYGSNQLIAEPDNTEPGGSGNGRATPQAHRVGACSRPKYTGSPTGPALFGSPDRVRRIVHGSKPRRPRA